MDIAFDEEPTGTAGTSEGFGFVAESSVGGDVGFGDSSSGLGDDLGLGGFTDAPVQAHAPEVFEQPAAQSYSPPPPAPVVAAPAPVAMFAAPEAENPLTIWEAQHKTHLKEKAEKEKVNNDKMRKDADAWLKQFSEERKKNHDIKHKDNQANEAAFKQEVEKIYTTGPTWTRVNSLVDLQQKTDRKDVGRMKSVLTQVKEAPPAHMSK